MKKIITSLIVVLTTMIACAQNQESTNAETVKVNQKQTAVSSDNVVVYQLFPTQNMWTFIKLNTRTGQIWQVQYSVKGDDYRFETYLNLRPLVPEEEEVNGRFILYSTQNTYNFILLDQIDGRTWQVQWSQDAENRGVIPIG